MGPYKTYTDQQLSALLKEGNERAYTEIYNRYWQTIYAIAYNRLRNMEAAQDLIHDTFASLWISREKVIIDNLKSYLGVAVKYRVIEYIRREKLQNSYEQSRTNQFISGTNTIEEVMHFKHVLDLVDQEIESLPEKCKLIFKYSRKENKSSKEIAEELNLSQSTVENQLNKALNRLRGKIKGMNSFLFSIFL